VISGETWTTPQTILRSHHRNACGHRASVGFLDELRLIDNTYSLFKGDNGRFMGERGFTSRVLPYEELTHVPMIVAGPGMAATKQVQERRGSCCGADLQGGLNAQTRRCSIRAGES
jgi:hypothetical protein